MMDGVILIAVIAVMGGAIAYIGDKLGSKIGKKRISVFDLRPKHTSILMTVITGIVIAGLTIATMIYTSKDVRTALFGMERLRAEFQMLNDSVEVKNKEIEFTQNLLAEKGKALSDVEGQIQILRGERSRLETDLAQAQQTVAEAEAQLQEAVNTKNKLQTEIAGLSKIAERLQAGLVSVREGQIIFRAGEVVASGVLEATAEDKGNEQRLNEFMIRTNSQLLDRLGIENKKLQILYMPEEYSRELLSQMQQFSGHVHVRLLAVGNLVYGDPILVQPNILPNKLIYQRGEIIYKNSFDLRGRDEQEVLVEILQGINAAAVKGGVLPDPMTGTVGNLSIAEMVNLTSELQKHRNSAINVSVSARKDIYLADQVAIDISVTKQLGING